MANQKTILITGASSGIGKHAALALIKEGHIVYGSAPPSEEMDEILRAGGHSITMDVTIQDQIKEGVEQILSEQNRIDVLINNAGYGLYGSIEDVTIEEGRHQFDVNMFGLARVTKEVLPFMRKQRSGTIINMSSMAGKVYTPLGAWYHATKHAVEGWSDCLRLEVDQFNINVVIIQPGAINTGFGKVMVDPLLKRSAGSPYEHIAIKVANSVKDLFENKKGSDPQVITNLILKAIRSKKPKIRYSAGKYARPMMLTRKFLGDRIYDSILLRQM